jgi:hypothetical protein
MQHEYHVDGQRFVLYEDDGFKRVTSSSYNYLFSKKTGHFLRWGKTFDDDPVFSPVGPEILDLEVSVNGCPNGCRFCYKGNTPEPATNMTFDTFKNILDRMPKTLTQIAFGITGVQTNPDFIKMMGYSRSIGVIPNFTLSGIDLTDEIAEQCSKLVGALAVSAYASDKNICYNTVKKFTDLGVKQTNIHLLISDQTLDFAYEVLNDRLQDSRLADMNAVVFLGVKPKGRATNGYSTISLDQFEKLVKFCFDKQISIGFDSCTAPKFEAVVSRLDLNNEQKAMLMQCSESCESSLFSAYINVNAMYWHCSFTEDEEGFEPINVLQAEDFIKDVWYSKPVEDFRNKVIVGTKNGSRRCVVFDSINLGE